ncbi:MAG TPA: hypothetical protein VHV57_16660 [Acidimicrobiales bacterium]|jgi:hypothetical protein|nr:hypothetical protein [Acidimicrobiales bacterium]
MTAMGVPAVKKPGCPTASELEAFLLGVLAPSAYDLDVIAHSLNERFSELGGTSPCGLLGRRRGPVRVWQPGTTKPLPIG